MSEISELKSLCLNIELLQKSGDNFEDEAKFEDEEDSEKNNINKKKEIENSDESSENSVEGSEELEATV